MTDDLKIDRAKNGKVTVTVTFADDAVAKAEEVAIKELGKDITLDGFRAGAAPVEKLRPKLSEGDILNHVVRSSIPEVMEAAIKEHEIKPIIAPAVAVESAKPLTVAITFIEKPAVKVKAVKPKIEAKEPKVDPKDFDRMLDYVLKQHQVSEVVDRPAQELDRVTMDFWGDDVVGNEIPGIRTTGHEVIIGSKILLPGFEDELVGLKAGDEKTFTLTFPEKHQVEELQGKPVNFHVTVTKVEKVTVPELTDDFVKKTFQAESADAFKKEIETTMLQQETQAEMQRREQIVLKAIAEATTVELVDELVNDEYNALKGEFLQQLAQQGLNEEAWIAQTGKTKEQVEEEFKKQAKDRLTVRFGLAQLVADKDVQIDEAALQEEVDRIIKSAPEDKQAEAKDAYQPGKPYYEQLKWEKQAQKLIAEFIN